MLEALFIAHPDGGSALFAPDPVRPDSNPSKVRAFLMEQYRRQNCYGTSGYPVPNMAPTAGAQLTLASFAPVRDLAKPSEALSAIRRLRTMAGYSANWDGEGAPAPHRQTVDAAVVMIGFLATEHLRLRATLNAEGQPLILISRGDAEGEITLTSASTFDYAWYSDAGEFGDADVAFDGRRLPLELEQALLQSALAAA